METPESKPPEAPSQAKADEQTVFVLAALMIDVYGIASGLGRDLGDLIKNRQMLQVKISHVTMLLNGNPGFVERFKATQLALLKASGMEVSTEGVVTPPKPRIVIP